MYIVFGVCLRLHALRTKNIHCVKRVWARKNIHCILRVFGLTRFNEAYLFYLACVWAHML